MGEGGVIESIIEQIRALSIEERRILFRRLRVSGLLEKDLLSTDQNRLQVATAIGENPRIIENRNVPDSPPDRDPNPLSLTSGFGHHDSQNTPQHTSQQNQGKMQEPSSFDTYVAPETSSAIPFDIEEAQIRETVLPKKSLFLPLRRFSYQLGRNETSFLWHRDRQSDGLTNDVSGYRSLVSGKVVVGAPTSEAKTSPEQDDRSTCHAAITRASA